MRATILLQLFFSLCLSTVCSQKAYNTTGLVVTMNDLQNTVCNVDSLTNAFYIYQQGHSWIDHLSDMNLRMDIRGKIKILNSAGYQHATIKIPLHKNKYHKEELKNVIAHTHTLVNGKIIKTQLSKNNIFIEDYNAHFNIAKFTFPNLKPGAVLTYSYTKERYEHIFPDWSFQGEIPKLYSEFKIDIPAAYDVNIRLTGSLPLTKNISKKRTGCVQNIKGDSWDCSQRIFAVSNIPALPKENYVSSNINFKSSLQIRRRRFISKFGDIIRYATKWKDAEKQIKSSLLGEQLRKINIANATLPKALKEHSKNLNKAKKIYAHIRDSFTWNEVNEIWDDIHLKQIVKDKTGNIGQINILLHNALKAQKFNVTPVLLSKRSNGLPTKLFPSLVDFNAIIVQLQIDGNTYFLDASDKLVPFGALPFDNLNQYGRLLDFKNGSSWVDLTPGFRSFQYFTDHITLTKEHQLNGNQEHAFNGYYGLKKRKYIQTKSESNYRQEIIEGNDEVTISDIFLSNTTALSKPFIQKQTIQKKVDEVDNLLYINPFTTIVYKENPFKNEVRSYPIDFGYPDSFTYMVYLEIPNDYTFKDIPKNLNYTLPNNSGQIRVSYIANASTLQLRFNVKLNQAIYSKEYYDSLKAFYNHLVDINTNTIVTVKKL